MAKQDTLFYLKLVLATLVLGGGTVITLVYGPAALLTAVPILLFGALLVIAPYLVLVGLERLVKRYLDDPKS